MEDKRPTIVISGKSVRCTGDKIAPHPEVVLALAPNRITSCPICGRRYAQVGHPGRIDPAVWPRDD